MGGISSTIQLTDAMSPVLVNITGALHATLSAFEAMQTVASINMDTTIFESARAAITESDLALAQYQERLQSLQNNPPVPPTPPTPPTPPVPAGWQDLQMTQVFMNSGAERFEAEMNAVNGAMRNVLQSQQHINFQAASMDLLPDAAFSDFNQVQARMETLHTAFYELNQTPLHLQTDDFSNQVELIRRQMEQIAQVQIQIDGSLGAMDTTAANASMQQLNDMLESVTRRIRDINAQQIAPQWQTIHSPQIFMDTGAERFTQEMNATNQAMQEVLQMQQQISAQAANVRVLPDAAFSDFSQIQARMETLQTAMQGFSQIPFYMQTDALNNQIEGIRQQYQQLAQLQAQASHAVIHMDTAGANASMQQISSIMDGIMRQIREINAQQVTPQWQSGGSPQVFLSSGAERFAAEYQAAQQAAQQFMQTQQQVTTIAQQMRVVPPGMLNDIATMQNRIQMVSSRIQALNTIPVNLRTDAVNNQMETLRQQLAQATQAQDLLNAAMQRADLSAANAAYQQLNSVTDAIERNIRDNIGAQEQFNDSVRQGTAAAGGLESMIRRYASAFLGMAGIKKVFDLSDTLTQSTARINMMIKGTEQGVDEVQDKIFGAAQRSRASYQGMLDMVGSFGVRAKAAFTTTNETIQFAENVNKLYAIAGTKQAEAAGATLQLTQALGSGVLRGQELNAVFNAAPNLIQTVADYMEVDIGEIRELAAEGELSAQVVKNAVLAATGDINEDFENMPVTFGQVMTSVANQALMAFQPVLQQLGAITDSERFQGAIDGVISGLVTIADTATQIFDVMVTGAAWVCDNWSNIVPVIGGVIGALGAFTIMTWISEGAAKKFFETLLKNPLFWIAIGIGIVISMIVRWVQSVGGIKIAWLTVTDKVLTLWDDLALKGRWLWMQMSTMTENIIVTAETMKVGILNKLGNMKVAGLTIIQDFVNSAIDNINWLIESVNEIAGTSFDMVAHVEWGANAAIEEAAKQAEREKYLENLQIAAMISQGNRQESYDAAVAAATVAHALRQTEIDTLKREAALGVTVEEDDSLLKEGNYNTSYIADSTHDISDSLEITKEDLKYLKDIAERETINRFTTAEISVNLGGVSNIVNQATDLDGMVDYLTEKLTEQMVISAAGVH